MQEELDVVPDAPRPVRPEVREILADLGRVHSRELGQALRGDRRHLVLGRFEQGPVVQRQAGDRRFGDAASCRVGHPFLPFRPRRRRRAAPSADLVCRPAHAPRCAHFAHFQGTDFVTAFSKCGAEIPVPKSEPRKVKHRAPGVRSTRPWSPVSPSSPPRSPRCSPRRPRCAGHGREPRTRGRGPWPSRSSRSPRPPSPPASRPAGTAGRSACSSCSARSSTSRGWRSGPSTC